MQRPSLKTVLGRPAFHLLLALGFAVAFFWPIFALTRPAQTFHFLHFAWLGSLLALFAISRGAAPHSSTATDSESDSERDSEAP